MVPLFDGPFKHHSLDEPEGDRDRAVTLERDIVTILCERIQHLINSDSRSERSGRFFCTIEKMNKKVCKMLKILLTSTKRRHILDVEGGETDDSKC